MQQCYIKLKNRRMDFLRSTVAIRRIGDGREWVTMLGAQQAIARWIIHSQSGTEPTPTTEREPGNYTAWTSGLPPTSHAKPIPFGSWCFVRLRMSDSTSPNHRYRFHMGMSQSNT
jgi:hypothetical protein